VDGRFLYALDPADGAIDMFQINRDGSITALGAVAGGVSQLLRKASLPVKSGQCALLSR
jgi:hypothetical protein